MSLTPQQYAALAQDSYQPRAKGDQLELGGLQYTVLKHVDKGGYQGTIYQRQDNGEIVVAHRGTEFDRQPFRDGWTDLRMVAGRVNNQSDDAIGLTRDAVKMSEQIGRQTGTKPEVTVTGHSLGGTLAQISAHHFDLRGETFNAYGAVSLGMRIPEGGTRVTNNVMAGDPVSAASDHYGQVKTYATQQEIDTMKNRGYENTRSQFDLRNDLGAAIDMVGTSHSMHNFLNVDANGKPDRSVLGDQRAKDLAQQYDPMIDKYRNDIELERKTITVGTRSGIGLIKDAVDGVRGTIPAGEPAREEERKNRHSSLDSSSLRGANDDVLPGREPASRHASLASDPSSYLDRMLAASKSGDREAFRSMTQAAADTDQGRSLRVEASATVDRQEQQQLAAMKQSQQAQDVEQPTRSAPRMA